MTGAQLTQELELGKHDVRKLDERRLVSSELLATDLVLFTYLAASVRHVVASDSVNNPYGDLPLDDTTRDLLASPSVSPIHAQHHLLHLQHRQHLQERQVLDESQLQYVSQPHTPYSTLPEAHIVGHYDYGHDGVPVLIPQPRSDMRTGPGSRGGGRVGEASTGRKGWKRKKEDRNEDLARQQNKLDSSQRCDVCGEQASGHYFGALVCLPCKSFFIRCTKDGRPNFSNQCGGKCDVLKGGRVRCQHCRFQKCISAGMYRKEKPEAVEPAEGQLLCKVCGDIANGVHFGVTTCEGCKKFFRRGLKENRTYTCKASQMCSINPRMRNNCRYCRYKKCITEGMSREDIVSVNGITIATATPGGKVKRSLAYGSHKFLWLAQWPTCCCLSNDPPG
ncbi:hypothetical protein Btru_056609 [Bulinus truncatus]|nr:hypothetical protein Btru_056609 [Bulinus truncatus]